ncbi:hypothetical protein [Streptomyces sp. NPDC005148]
MTVVPGSAPTLDQPSAISHQPSVAERSGEGQVVDAAMTDRTAVQLALMRVRVKG